MLRHCFAGNCSFVCLLSGALPRLAVGMFWIVFAVGEFFDACDPVMLFICQ